MVSVVVVNVLLFIVLVVELGTAATSLGLLAHNSFGGFCGLFIPAHADDNFDKSRAACGINFTTAVLATIGLAVVTFIEFNKLVFGSVVKTAGVIIQFVAISVSTVCQLITLIVTSIGWSKTCNNLSDSISCTGYDSLTFVGGEFIAAAVLSGIGFLLGIVAVVTLLMKKLKEKRNTAPNYNNFAGEGPAHDSHDVL